MIRRPPRSTPKPSSAASDVYKRQDVAKAFSWKSLLPQWMVDVLGSETGKKLAETASLAVDWWKKLLPSWIVNILEGKSPFAERDEGADVKKVEEAKRNLMKVLLDWICQILVLCLI